MDVQLQFLMPVATHHTVHTPEGWEQATNSSQGLVCTFDDLRAGVVCGATAGGHQVPPSHGSHAEVPQLEDPCFTQKDVLRLDVPVAD